MQYEFNDYKRLTRGYLKDYRMWQNAIDAWAQERADIEAELASVPVAVSKYGRTVGGGSGELTPTEREANRRQKLHERCLSIDMDTQDLKRVMKNIDTAIRSLEDEDARIVLMHYVDGRTWYDVADAFSYSESAVKQKGCRAIGKIAGVLFGGKAQQYSQVILIA